jgi:integrase
MYRTIERTLEPWLARELHTITPEMVEARHRELAGVNARYKGEANANFAMKTLGILYGFAEERHAGLPPNPVKRLKRQTRMVKTEELPRFYQAVMALENTIIRDYILLILFTGLRRAEAASLRWQDVDFVAGCIRLPAARTKAKRELVLPMSDFVRDLLVARRAIGNAGFVFPGRRHNQHLTGSIETAWALLATATGIKVSAHDLRRTFASVAGETEISPFALKMMLNHSAGSDVTGGYVILSPTALRQAVQKVAARMQDLCGIVPVRNVTRLRRGS